MFRYIAYDDRYRHIDGSYVHEDQKFGYHCNEKHGVWTFPFDETDFYNATEDVPSLRELHNNNGNIVSMKIQIENGNINSVFPIFQHG